MFAQIHVCMCVYICGYCIRGFASNESCTVYYSTYLPTYKLYTLPRKYNISMLKIVYVDVYWLTCVCAKLCDRMRRTAFFTSVSVSLETEWCVCWVAQQLLMYAYFTIALELWCGLMRLFQVANYAYTRESRSLY